MRIERIEAELSALASKTVEQRNPKLTGTRVAPQVKDAGEKKTELSDLKPPSVAVSQSTLEESKVKADFLRSGSWTEEEVAERFLRAIEDGGGITLTLWLNFEFDSCELQTENVTDLDMVGQALSNVDMQDARLVIAVHTDATGTAEYNLKLSECRANAVRDYLVVLHAVQGDRLRPKGYGESHLLSAEPPTSALNRRVEFVAYPQR